MKVVIKAVFVVLFALTAGASVFASEMPSTGAISNELESSHLEYKCSEINPTRVKCEFVQTSVRKPSYDEVYAEFDSNLARCNSEMSEDGQFAKLQEGTCPDFAVLRGLLDGSINRTNSANYTLSGKKIDNEVFEKMENSPSEVRGMNTAKFQALGALCGSNSVAEACKAMLTEENELKLRTCKVSSNKFTQIFSRLNSENNVWTVEDKPSGDCGIINVSRFEQDDYGMWDYISQKVVTNPTAKALGLMKCSDFDQKVYKFSWNVEGYEKHCDFIKFGL